MHVCFCSELLYVCLILENSKSWEFKENGLFEISKNNNSSKINLYAVLLTSPYYDNYIGLSGFRLKLCQE